MTNHPPGLMPSSDALQRQLLHMEWADARVWDVVLATAEAEADARLGELLHHVHLVQHLYLQVWRGDALTPSTRADFGDLRTLLAWSHRFHQQVPAVLAAADAEGLQRPVHFPWAAQLEQRFGEVHPATLQDSVLQIVLHTAHHRGQICTRLRELGSEPPLVDYVVWVWQGAPLPVWPEPLAG